MGLTMGLLLTFRIPGKHSHKPSGTELTEYAVLYRAIQKRATPPLNISAIQLTEERLSKATDTASTPNSPSSNASCSRLFAPPESSYARLNFQSKFGQI